jgi:HSP20 family molecular chaperone IbpA
MDGDIARVERRAVVPSVRVMEDESEVVAWIEMPGVTREGLEIKIDGNTLTIDGKRSDEIPSGKFLVRERRHSEYHKAFTIDESIDREGVAADLADGVLTLRLKVKEAAKPRRIAVG